MGVQRERVSIRSTTEADLSNLLRLWNDGQVMKWVGYPDGLGYDADTFKEWFDRLQASPDRHHFVVQAEGLGFCGEVYYAVDRTQRRAALDIKFVPEAQGRGLATEALKKLIRMVFESEPEVKAVWTEPWGENLASQRLYARCGLRPKPRPADLAWGPSYWELRRDDWPAG